MPAEIKEYKGKPVLVLTDEKNQKFPFTFGARKAKLIVDNAQAVKEFYEKFCELEEGGDNEPE